VVLIVEDHVDTANALHRILTRRGHDVVWAVDGAAALALVQNAAPRVVILDMGLPEMDGLEVLRALRARPDFNDVAVIIFTADLGQDRMLHAQRLGAREYFVKGTISWGALTNAIEKHLGNVA
jgi:DNA-binding response OmpR family regulator